jgi:hypothetical protein
VIIHQEHYRIVNHLTGMPDAAFIDILKDNLRKTLGQVVNLQILL